MTKKIKIIIYILIAILILSLASLLHFIYRTTFKQTASVSPKSTILTEYGDVI